MITRSSVSSISPSHRDGSPAGLVRLSMYVPAGLLTVVITVAGFWPTYFGPLLLGTVQATQLTHIHAAIQVTWLALFMTQIVLASTGHLAWHIKVGRWVMAYSIVVLFVALLVSFDKFGRDVVQGEIVRGQRRLFGLLREIVFIVPFIAAGWIYRNKPETHKRLMVVATLMLSVPAIGRMRFFLGEPVALWQYMLIWPLPVYLLVIHDYAKRKLIHPVYVIAIAAMLGERLVLPLRDTAVWMTISAWLVPFYQTPLSGS